MKRMADLAFDTISLLELEALHDAVCDGLPYGVVGFDKATVVETYNATEARMSGLNPDRVVGVPFFEAVGQCMNNYMVAQRFEDEPELDAIVPYVLTLRMRPTRVRLRLLATAASSRRYILIER
jgi:photoactive yellow protein